MRVRKTFLLCFFIFHFLGPLQIVWFSSTPDFITEGKRIDLECYSRDGLSLRRSTGSRMTKLSRTELKAFIIQRTRGGKMERILYIADLVFLQDVKSWKESIIFISEVSEFLQLIYVCK